MMSTEWTAQACDAWNKDATLTNGLGRQSGSRMTRAAATRSFTCIARDCGEGGPRPRMKIVPKDGKAMCVYGGARAECQDELRL